MRQFCILLGIFIGLPTLADHGGVQVIMTEPLLVPILERQKSNTSGLFFKLDELPFDPSR